MFDSLVYNNKTLPNQSQCVYCHKLNNEKKDRLILADDKTETACCAHCGLLRHRQLGEEVLETICHDFFIHTTISTPLTWYVIDIIHNVACCQPHVLRLKNGNMLKS